MGHIAVSLGLVSLQITCLLHVVRPSFVIPGMRTDVYYQPGDLVLGGLFRVHRFSTSELCSRHIQPQKQFQYHEAMVHAIAMMNKRNDILPNTTLGFAILDDCTKDQVGQLSLVSYTSTQHLLHLTGRQLWWTVCSLVYT